MKDIRTPNNRMMLIFVLCAGILMTSLCVQAEEYVSSEEFSQNTSPQLPTPDISSIDREAYQNNIIASITEKVEAPRYEQGKSNQSDVMNALLGGSSTKINYINQKLQELTEMIKKTKLPPQPPKLPPLPPKPPPRLPPHLLNKYRYQKPPVIPKIPTAYRRNTHTRIATVQKED